jgi:tRNA threonylcarbamoyl adenosine modification protein YeaZ
VILGIDTSGMVGSVALRLTRDDGTVDEREERFEEGMIHGVALGPSVASLLDAAGLSSFELTLVAVGTGPGSYTGVRVGVSFGKTLAFAAGVPVIGVPSFDAMATNAPAGRVVACVRNARRDALYVGLYEPDGTPRGDVALVPVNAVKDLLPADALVLGDATLSHADFLSGEGREFGDPAAGECPARVVARLGAERFAGSGADDTHALAPIYLRMSEAEERAKETDGPER